MGGSGKRRRRRREEAEPLGLTVLANTFREKLLEHSLIQTFPREHVPRPRTAVSC